MLSLFLIVGSMLAGLWLYQQSTSRVGVLVAARDLGPGDDLTIADTRVQFISAEPEFLSEIFSESQAQSVGFYSGSFDLTVGRSIPAGAPLIRAYLVPGEDVIPAGKTIVGIELDLGSYPNALRDGDTVDLLVTSTDDDITEAVPIGVADIWSARIDPSNGRLVADLIVDSEIQNTAVQAHGNDQLRITLVESGS